MTSVAGHFEELDFFECYLREPVIIDRAMKVEVPNLGLFPEHPLNSSTTIAYLETGTLVFTDVVKSVRIVHAYVGEPQAGEFKAPATVVNRSPIVPIAADTRVFAFEGVFDAPVAWIDWTVAASSFHLEV